jgi:hypothetical protein
MGATSRGVIYPHAMPVARQELAELLRCCSTVSRVRARLGVDLSTIPQAIAANRLPVIIESWGMGNGDCGE